MVKIIQLKPYRTIYFTFLVISVVFTVLSYLLVSSGFYLHWEQQQSVLYKNIFVYTLIGLAILFTSYLSKQRKKIQAIEEYDVKISLHLEMYKHRILWGFANCTLACILYPIIAHSAFLYFAIFDIIFSLLMMFPNKIMFRKELNDDEIEFI